MASAGDFEMVAASQATGQSTVVGTLDGSRDSGFREGNPVYIQDGAMWDASDRPLQRPANVAFGDGRVTRSISKGLQSDNNTIPGSGRNNPSGSGAPHQGGSGSGREGGGHGPGNSEGSGPSTHANDRNGGGDRNGGTPHPGNDVGHGSTSSAHVPGGTGPSSLLAKMFLEPLKDPVPMNAHFLPCDSEELSSEREGKGTQYSPVMWADPLIPINMSIGSTSSAIDVLPAVGVSVSNKYESIEPQLTQQGMMLKALIDTEASPTILRSMMPIKGMKDVSALICLMETARRSGFQSLSDEALLLRLGLLMHCMAPVEWLAYSTSCVQNVGINAYSDIAGAKRTWTPAPAQSTNTEIGIEAGASTLFWRTLSQYARLISGQAVESDRLLDSAKKEVDVNLIKFVPVKMSWRGQSWLGPYILAHTTTKWWNHSVVIDIPVKVHDIKTATNKATLKCMPKAATVYLPGSFKYICLVIVDVVESSFPVTEAYYIGNTHKATYGGNPDFGKIAHKIIGRNSELPAIPATMVDCLAAWRVMCKGLLSHVKPSAVEVKLAVLVTSRFAGFSVWTDEVKAKKKKAVDEGALLSDLCIDEDDAPQDIFEWMDVLRDLEKDLKSSTSDPEMVRAGELTVEDRVSLVRAVIADKFTDKKCYERDIEIIIAKFKSTKNLTFGHCS